MDLEEMSYKRAISTLLTSTLSAIIIFKGEAIGIASEQVQAITAFAVQGVNAAVVIAITLWENKVNIKVKK